MTNVELLAGIELIENKDEYIHSIKKYRVKVMANQMNKDQFNKSVFFNNTDRSFSGKVLYSIKDSSLKNDYGSLAVYDRDVENQCVHIDGFYTEDNIEEYKEGVRNLLKYVFENMIARKVFVKISGDNNQLKNIYNDLGFSYEATLKEYIYVQGEFKDVEVMSFCKSSLSKSASNHLGENIIKRFCELK